MTLKSRRSIENIQLRESNPLDSTRLNDFFSSIQIEGNINLKVRRQIDFFSFYQRLNLKFKNYIFENEKSEKNIFPLNSDVNTENIPEILGTASFLFQNRRLYNSVVKIALACDLRISHKRKAVMNWAHFFLPRISKLQIEENIDHFITSINLTEKKAINAFLRPKKTKADSQTIHYDHLPIYELIHKYNLVSIHGFFPFMKRLQKNITVTYATELDKNDLILYLNENFKKYDFMPNEIITDLESYIQNSILYSFSRFLIARDLNGKIIGCVHPISSTLLQDYFPQKYDQHANNFRQFLKFASLFRFARTLTRPFSSTNKEQTLNFKIFHFLFFDHPEVLKSLVSFAYNDSKMNEFILYAYQKNQYSHRPPKGSLHSEIPYGLYEIKKSDQPAYQTKIKITKNIFLDYLWF